MKRVKRTKKKVHWLIPVMVVAAVAFVFVKMVQLHVQWDERQQEKDALDEQINIVTIQNEDLQAKNENMDSAEGQEQYLRDNGFVKDDDQVYVYANN